MLVIKPQHLSLTSLHMMIVPLQHVPSSLSADDNVLLEIERYKSCIKRMLGIIIIIIFIIIITIIITIIKETTNQIPLFIETSCHHTSNPHAYIDVVNIDIKYEADARIYFTEAINHCDEEWATHKRYPLYIIIIITTLTLTNERLLYITEEKPLKNIVPKHFPYISIEWCHCDSKKGCYGIAHVIENDSRFSSDFCLDVVAGMLRKVIAVVVAA